jgi:hypothetical protein
MAKRSNPKRNRELDEEFDYFLEDDEVEEVQHTTVRLLKDMKVRVKGYVSGNTYIFNGAGSELDVLNVDLEGILNKRSSKLGCCSDKFRQPKPYFEVVE